MNPFKYFWQMCVKGVALLFIFFGGGVLAVVIIPIAGLVGGPSIDRTQRFIHYSFKAYLRVLLVCGMIRLEINGAEKFAGPGRMVIANHPSLLDVVILMSLIPKVQCIVKHQLWDHRYLGFLMRSAGYIPNDLPPEKMLERCKTAMDSGQLLIVFPEGTRTRPNALPHFQRGFSNIAMLTSSKIQPVVIHCDPPTLFKGEPWWHITEQTPHFRLFVNECLETDTYLLYNTENRSLIARKLTKSMELFYAEKLRNE